MFPHKQIPTFSYDAKDFNLAVKLYKEKESLFDNILQQTWNQAEEIKAFRYTLNIRSTKSLKGRYRFLVQVGTGTHIEMRTRGIFLSNIQYNL